MTKAGSPKVIHQDGWVQTPNGRLFARSWDLMRSKSGRATEAPIILFHDSLGCVDLWRSFPARLGEAAGRRIIAYDRLGYGKSDACQYGLSHEFIREEAEICFPELCRQLDIHEFIAFGHSVGGAMAVFCAGKFPDLCRATVTESAQTFVEDKTLRGIRQAMWDFQRPGQLDRLKKYHGTKAEWVLNAWTATWLAPGFAKWSLEANLPRVKCPVLAIHGSEDEFGSTRHPEMIGRLVSGPSRVEILPGCRHVPHKEHEETVVSLVVDFLQLNERND